MKDENQVIQEFNDVVNMTAAELEKWLKSDDSNSAGWPKEGEDGESVGHDSGRKIVEILKDNPEKKPDKYTEDQIQHMRKVVSYCKRHLAQEKDINDTKSVEEVKKTKSYASLRNWGHDILKERDDGGKASGDKRSSKEDQDGENKRRKTDKSTKQDQVDKNGDGAQSTEDAEGEAQEEVDEDNDNKDDNEEEEEVETDEAGEEAQENGQDKADKQDTNGKKSDKKTSSEDASEKDIKKGDTVSWNWGQAQPEGKVKDVKASKTSIETKSGNTVSRDGTSDDPAVVLDTGKSKAIKLSHELN